MPPRARKPVKKKCNWRGCAYLATYETIAGDFCSKHAAQIAAGPVAPSQEDAIQMLTEAVIDIPQVRKAMKRLVKPLDRVGALLDRIVPFVDRATQQTPPPRPPPGSPPPRTHARPKPPSDPEPKPDNPRVVLGFALDAKLTEKMIRDRRKELARIFHSDTKGNEESMKKVNIAADALLKEVGAK